MANVKISDIATEVTDKTELTWCEGEKSDGSPAKFDPAILGGAGVEASAVDVPAVADYTWANQGGASASDGTSALILTSRVDNTLAALYKTAPSAPYDVYMRLEEVVLSTASDTSATELLPGLILRNSSDGKQLHLIAAGERISGDRSFYPSVKLQRMTSAGAYSAESFKKVMSERPKWLRVNVTSTTVTAYVSVDGKNWISAGTETIATYIGAVNQIGFGSRVGSNATSHKFIIHQFGTTAP